MMVTVIDTYTQQSPESPYAALASCGININLDKFNITFFQNDFKARHLLKRIFYFFKEASKRNILKRHQENL